MKYSIEEMKTRTSSGTRTIFFELPNNTYLLQQKYQPNNLSIEDRLSIHNDFAGMTYDHYKKTMCISFSSTLQTDKQLSTFVAECFALCEYGIK